MWVKMWLHIELPALDPTPFFEIGSTRSKAEADTVLVFMRWPDSMIAHTLYVLSEL